MKNDSQPLPPLFSQVDAAANAPASAGRDYASDEHTQVLRELLSAQDRQNELMEELISQFGAAQRQRAAELAQWKQAHPQLARQCRNAAEVLGRIQTQFLDTLTTEINDNAEELVDGEFLLNEFVDRFGPRLAHLNGVLQVLSQLSTLSSPAPQ